jgi:hypothetical protein
MTLEQLYPDCTFYLTSTARARGRGQAVTGHRSVQFTERDLAILRDLTRFWAMTVEQVARRHFGAVKTAANRLAALRDAGVVRVERPRFRGPSAYLTTATGARLAAVGLPAARFVPALMAHRLAVVDLADVLLARAPGATWIGERELRRDAMRTVRCRGRRWQRTSGCCAGMEARWTTSACGGSAPRPPSASGWPCWWRASGWTTSSPSSSSPPAWRDLRGGEAVKEPLPPTYLPARYNPQALANGLAVVHAGASVVPVSAVGPALPCAA